MKSAMPRLLLFSLLTCLFVLSIGWQAAPAEKDSPEGCGEVFTSTSRGGATASVGGGGCNILRHDPEGEMGVVRVIDGDTIEVSGGHRVRYIGIDTPEVGDNAQYYGLEATNFNKSLVEGRKVFLERDVSEKDRFGRALRFVYADGIRVNAELVREGYARAKAYPPDTQYDKCFATLEREARESSRGMWGTPQPGDRQ